MRSQISSFPRQDHGHRPEQARDTPASRRRRRMAFMKYGSDDAPREQTRQRAKNIAMKLSMDVSSPMSIQSTSTFADFGAAFPSAPARMLDKSPYSSRQARPPSPDVSFETDWPSAAPDHQTMFSMPSNSSMQSKFTLKQHNMSSPPAGAAARRRMRTQMRSSHKSPAKPPEGPLSTPPQSPDRRQKDSSIRSGRKDRLSNYRSTPGKSIADHAESMVSDASLFHSDNAGGFTFDAFGLDAAQINQAVNAAMNDMSESDASFTDEFARWEQSPNTSRSSTPAKDDGFVDGFRVNRPRQSPAGSTERSSLASDDSGRVNLFKEKAGFQSSRRKGSQPVEAGQRSLVMQPQAKRRLPSMPVLENDGNVYSKPSVGLTKSGYSGSPRSKSDVEFFDDSSTSSVEGRKGPLHETEAKSDVGVTSDAGFASDAGVNSEDDESPGAAFVNIPAEVKPKMRKGREASDTHTASTESTSHDEKKEDFEDSLPTYEARNKFGDVRSRWETKTSPRPSSNTISPVRRPKDINPSRPEPDGDGDQPMIASPHVSPMKADPRQQQPNLQQRKYGDHVRPEVTVVYEPTKEQESRPSWMATRDRIRSKTAKSEGGSQVRQSHVNAILANLEASSPRDSKSDVGTPATGSALPSFFNVQPKTRNTTDDSRRRDEASAVSVVHTELPSPVQPTATKQLTYKERREMELAKEREDMERQAEPVTAKRDVAALIKKRIAAAKRVQGPSQPESHPSPLPVQPSVRDLAPTESSAYEESAPENASTLEIQHKRPSRITHQSPERIRRGEPSDLLIETESPRRREESLPPNPAVSHMMMLQQLQQRAPVVPEVETVPTEKESTSAVDDTESQVSKAITPKATMMMLNAFLAGRGTVAAADVPATDESQAQPQHTDAEQKPEEPESTLPSLKNDPKYSRYFKMLSIGMPIDVVKHAMTRDGFDPSVMDGDHNKPVGVPLKLDPTYAKYFRMLSIGLPMDAVKHSMARDGLDPTVMDRDHDLPAKSGNKSGDEESKEKDSHRRARLHWNTLRKVTSNSLWAKIDQEHDIMGNIEIDEEEFQELFQVERNAAVESKPKSTDGPRRGATVRVIDPKRANNGGIILARLKMSHDEMANAVDRINEQALNAEQIEHIIEYLPTKEERKALETYMLEGGQDAAEKFEGLCECEKFMVSMMTVKLAKRKVRALLFKLQFESCVRDIQEDAFLVEGACDELSNSVRLRQLLGFILEFGNRLNTAGNGKKKAGAFTLDSLLKLNQAKAFDKKTTFLTFIVKMVQRNSESLLHFKDDLPTVFKADRVAWEQCVGDLEEVENQLENVRRISLYQARQAQAYRLRRRNKSREEDEESLCAEDSLSLEEEVEALKSTPVGCFTLSAIKYISALRDKVEETRTKFSRLLEYFGEEDESKQPHDLFRIIVSFSRDFGKASEEVAAHEKRRIREDKKRQSPEKKAKLHRQASGKSPQQARNENRSLLRASNHQPSLGNVMQELTARSAHTRSAPQPIQSLSLLSIAQQKGRVVRDADHSDPGRPVVPPRRHRHEASRTRSEQPRSPQPETYADELPEVESSSSKSMDAMRQKAHMRRQKYGVHRSTHGAVITGQPPLPEMVSQHVQHQSIDQQSPTKPPTQLSRSSVHNRRRLEQRRMRQEAVRNGSVV